MRCSVVFGKDNRTAHLTARSDKLFGVSKQANTEYTVELMCAILVNQLDTKF